MRVQVPECRFLPAVKASGGCSAAGVADSSARTRCPGAFDGNQAGYTSVMRAGSKAWRSSKKLALVVVMIFVVVPALSLLRSFFLRMQLGGNRDATHPWARQGHDAPAPPAGILTPLVLEAGIVVDTSANGFPQRVNAARLPRLPPSGEPAGIVFDAAGANSSRRLPAAVFLAAAGAPIRVIENTYDLKKILERCRFVDVCASEDSDITTRLHAETARLIASGATLLEEGAPTPPAVLEQTDDMPRARAPWGELGENMGAVAEDLVEAWVPRSEAEQTTTSSGANFTRAGGLVGEGADEEREREDVAVGFDSRGGGEKGSSCDEEWPVLMLGVGWLADDMEALLRAFPDTPWLYLHPNDSTTSTWEQEKSARDALRLMSTTPPGSSKGVVMASSQFGPAAAARLLTRHFGGRLPSLGELSMSKLYARRGSKDDEIDTSDCSVEGSREDSKEHSAERAAVGSAKGAVEGPAGGEGSLRKDALADGRGETISRLLKISTESAKILGGPFDTDWWRLSPAAEEGHGGTAPREQEFQDRYVGTSTSGLASSSRHSSQFPSPSVEGGSDSNPADDHVAGVWGRGISVGGRRGGDTRQRGPGGSSTSEEGEGGEGNLPRQWNGRGLRRLVDGHAPLWMSSEVYSEPVAQFPCPDRPTPGYPTEWPLLDLLRNWNPGNASAIPERHFLGICRFDYQTELHKAQAYAFREVPFIVYNVPEMDQAVQEWSDPTILSAALGDEVHSIDVSSSNRFLYYGRKSLDRPPGWTPPTRRTFGTFDSWLLDALAHGVNAIGTQLRDLINSRPDPMAYGGIRGHRRGKAGGISQSQPAEAVKMNRSMDPQSREGSLGSLGEDSCRSSSATPLGLENYTVGEKDADDGDERGRGCRGIAGSGRCRAGVDMVEQPREEEKEDGRGVEGGRSRRGAGEHFFYLKLSSTVERPNRFIERSLPFFNPLAPTLNSHAFLEQYSGALPESNPTGKYLLQDHLKTRRVADWWDRGRSAPSRTGREEAEDVDPSSEINIFLRDAFATKGIHCRLGMDGVMSEGHYDGSRNMVALLAGKRRWILSRPQNCRNMHMFPNNHPSARHTSADWTDPEVESRFPRLAEATANEVILRAGEMLYVPEHWIHAVVNIGVSAQCNSRSGKSFEYQDIIEECELEADGE